MDKVIIWWVSRDWLLTMQFVKDLSTIFATITAGIVAILGLRTWKIQLKGRTEYDLAKKLLVEIYKIKESLLFVRSFYMSGGERANAYEKLKLDLEKEDPGYDGKILRSVYFIRMKGLNENHNNLHILRLESRAIWGLEIDEHLFKLDEKIKTLKITLDIYTRAQIENSPLNPDNIEKYERIIFGHSDDDFSKDIESIIQGLEAIVKPYLK
ncbi:MAG: hypothetical protein HON98_03450 [Chloroflexi bacterium]|nr:hypothetical protein [Chloroflexota bacterium]MBT3670414.1 hypothetical protein [Chloroflexota bacterium]MBT4003216.1 hypothetical protein [Chloroflexota bacterium]MBT4304629.1 hypothetical protein [Chloroflexota bacterium]MBT4532560.1 hypothetical protein [Chloroflexota bacterium]